MRHLRPNGAEIARCESAQAANGPFLLGGTRRDIGQLLAALLLKKTAPHSLAESWSSSGFEDSSTCSDDANGQQHGPDGVEWGVPARADDGQRHKEDPLPAKDESYVAGQPAEQWADRQPHGKCRRADGRDVAGGEGDLAVISPLDQRLDHVLAKEQSPCGERSVKDDTNKCPPRQADAEGDDEDGNDGRGRQEFSEIGPASNGRRRPEQSDNGILEPVRRTAMGNGRSQNRCCVQTHQRDDPKPGPRH